MATWPLSRIQTFLANSVPVISEVFLNGVQDVIVAVFNATITLKALVVDGTGATVVTPGLPTIGTTLPGVAPIRGEYARDAAPAGMGCVNAGFIDNAGAGLSAGFGIYELHRTGAGNYYVVFTRKPSVADAKYSVVQVTGPDDVQAVKTLDGNGRLKVTVTLAGGIDLPFDITAWIF